MSFYKRNAKEIQLIVFFTILKLTLHLVSNSNFGFHRDELLYMAMSEHIDWGYKEVPPFIAGISWFSYAFLGDSVFAMRILPSIASALIVFMTGLFVISMNGRRFSIIVACSAMVISPSFLASGYLLQPVVFDQLFWVISAYLVLKHIQTRKTNYIYLLGLTVGLGMLTKYTMAFFIFSLIIALLISPQRRVLLNKAWIVSFFIAFIIFLPNLIWQISHELPVVSHMRELKAKQLDYIDPFKFVIQLLITHASASVIWLSGLIYFFFTNSNKRYIFIAYSFILVVIILLVLNGKVYYSFGAFPMLFAAGGICLQKVLGSIVAPFRYAAVSLLLAPSLLLVPTVIPILPFASTLRFFEFTTQSGLEFPVKWEDQKTHATTQDYADMLGWEEIAKYAEVAYQKIPRTERSKATLIAGNYGLAGAIQHYGDKYNLPEPVSLSSSFALWSPDRIEIKYIIMIDDDIDDIASAFGTRINIGKVENPYAREKDTGIYLLSEPLVDINNFYKTERLKELNE
ncbi:glycosyltransferase family 39 protein [Daejeonella sp.]|uniref:glycosyltransferase family 39 protein n=1 Tax=Daejeonella sp. TaxID=2805397 RepID=UPI0030BD2567